MNQCVFGVKESLGLLNPLADITLEAVTESYLPFNNDVEQNLGLMSPPILKWVIDCICVFNDWVHLF